MDSMRRALLVCTVFACLVAVPLGYAGYRSHHFRNFEPVTPDVLYRSGQLSPYGLHRVWYENGIGTVISLRPDDGLRMRWGLAWDEDLTRPALPSGQLWEPRPWHVRGKGDRWEEAYCRRQAIRFVRLAPLPWHARKGQPIPAEANVERFVQILRDPVRYPRPILLHCFRGAHRTGVFVAIYRMEIERWSNEAALAELPAQGYDVEDHIDVCRYLRRYVPTWKQEQDLSLGGAPKQASALGPEDLSAKAPRKPRTVDPDVVSTGWISRHQCDLVETAWDREPWSLPDWFWPAARERSEERWWEGLRPRNEPPGLPPRPGDR
jgi:protein tyrosine phosphatase (PTP) superfamily phosphohydrolase (DUF442 family)